MKNSVISAVAPCEQTEHALTAIILIRMDSMNKLLLFTKIMVLIYVGFLGVCIGLRAYNIAMLGLLYAGGILFIIWLIKQLSKFCIEG